MVRAMVVDDDPEVRDLLLRILTDAGYSVSTARDGFDAIKQFRSQPADLVLADIFMPGKDGVELIQQLRKEFPAIKIVAISGGGGGGRVPLDLLPSVRFLGADAILYKPFQIQGLLDLCLHLSAPAPQQG